MKILFCTQLSALHAARWVNQFKDTGWTVHVAENFAPGWGICPEFEHGTFHVPKLLPARAGIQTICTFRGNRGYAVRQKLRLPMPLAWLQEQHEDYLAKWIQREKPDAIHLLGLGVNWMNQGLPLLRVKQRLGGFPCPWIYSSWGTDLDYFGRDPANQQGVKAVLSEVDIFISECERDCRLAKEFGFKGQFAGYFPAFGGTRLTQKILNKQSTRSTETQDLSDLARKRSLNMDVQDIQDKKGGASSLQPSCKSCISMLNPSSRKLLLLKGRDHANGGDPIGRAMTVMQALGQCAEDIKQAGCRVAIFQPDPTVTAEAHVLRASTGLEIELLPRLPYDGLMRLMGSARAVIAMTVNDGLPSILVEAMAFGALPIHSDLEPIREWIEEGKNGLLVGAEDVDATAEAIRRVVKDDELVDRAAEINGRLVTEKLEYGAVRKRAIEMYQAIVLSHHSAKHV